jgi:hypothetical protein
LSGIISISRLTGTRSGASSATIARRCSG